MKRSRFLTVMAANLRGQGDQAHTTITRLSQLMTTLGDNREHLFGTIRNLQGFTTTLARHLGESLRLLAPAFSIEREPEGMSVRYRENGQLLQKSFSAVVSTLPSHALANLAQQPGIRLGWGRFPDDAEVLYLYDSDDGNFGYAFNLSDPGLSEWGYAPFVTDEDEPAAPALAA